MSFNTPILFCNFNRPDLTRRVWDVIKSIQPRHLLLSCDGPRTSESSDQSLVDETRAIVSEIDWPCQWNALMPAENQGCKIQMATAINWAFEQYDRLIILEDDCLPDPTFFPFCQELLERYADDHRVMMISGDNFQEAPRSPFSYYFSCYSHIWGWATWRRAWSHFDLAMSAWPQFRNQNHLAQFTCHPEEIAYWTEVFDRQHSGQADTWDFSWAFACYANFGWTILPETNLVTNIGFGPTATHTIDAESDQANRPVGSIHKIQHPTVIARDVVADEKTWRNIFDPNRDAAPNQIARRKVQAA